MSRVTLQSESSTPDGEVAVVPVTRKTKRSAPRHEVEERSTRMLPGPILSIAILAVGDDGDLVADHNNPESFPLPIWHLEAVQEEEDGWHQSYFVLRTLNPLRWKSSTFCKE